MPCTYHIQFNFNIARSLSYLMAEMAIRDYLAARLRQRSNPDFRQDTSILPTLSRTLTAIEVPNIGDRFPNCT